MKTRAHEQEMIRFAKSEEGTAVWYRYKSGTKWDTLLKPVWSKPYIYILDNKYAELRKESVDTGRPIQRYNMSSLEWETPTHKLQFDVDLAFYRLEPEEEKFKYPIYKKSIVYGQVVKFTSEKEGVIIVAAGDRFSDHEVGHKSNDWVPHTDAEVWEDYAYEEPVYYYRWEKLYTDGRIGITDWVTDAYAEKHEYKIDKWSKKESSKRTWED